ncbi:MAG: ATPase [Alphaproteobacteria bacterium]|nr:ATPase [Alphaproteobacteria bacterium]
MPAASGFAVAIDGRPLRTPLGVEVMVPTKALADALAAELAEPAAQAGHGRLRAEAMPLMRMASTALDRITRHRADIEGQLLAYAETELLCHRAEHPPELVARQRAIWQPLLDWLALRHDALLTVTTGILAKPQSPASLEALRRVLAGLDAWRLTGVSVAVAASGSLVIGLAMADGGLDAGPAFEAAELDASYQIEQWGEDLEASRRRAGVRADLELAQRFFGLLDQDGHP